MILVTGATGTVGSLVVQELTDRGVDFRALVRDTATARAKLGTGVTLVEGDLGQVETVRTALRDVDTVFLACANGPRQVELETNVIRAAETTGVHRVVKLSAALAEVGSPLEIADWNGRIERELWASQCQALVLQPDFFMSNLLTSAGEILRTGKLYAPAGDARIAMIDPRDVAAVAAVTLIEPVYAGVAHVLTGPEALSYEQVAGHLSAATGRQIEFVNTSDEEARRNYRAAGMPPWLTEHLVTLFGMLRAGASSGTTDTVREVTGREPRTFAEFAHYHKAVFTQ